MARERDCLYELADDLSAYVKVTMRVTDGRGHAVRTVMLGRRRTGSVAHVFTFRVDLPRGAYSVRALATDRAGNPQSRAVAGKLRVR